MPTCSASGRTQPPCCCPSCLARSLTSTRLLLNRFTSPLRANLIRSWPSPVATSAAILLGQLGAEDVVDGHLDLVPRAPVGRPLVEPGVIGRDEVGGHQDPERATAVEAAGAGLGGGLGRSDAVAGGQQDEAAGAQPRTKNWRRDRHAASARTAGDRITSGMMPPLEVGSCCGTLPRRGRPGRPAARP